MATPWDTQWDIALSSLRQRPCAADVWLKFSGPLRSAAHDPPGLRPLGLCPGLGRLLSGEVDGQRVSDLVICISQEAHDFY